MMGAFNKMLIDSMERRYPHAPGAQRNSDTSHAAAQSMRPHYTVQQKKIADWLQEQGAHGGTYTEIVNGTGLQASSICGRMVELCQARVAIMTKRTRTTPSGRQAHVYVHKDCVTQED